MEHNQERIIKHEDVKNSLTANISGLQLIADRLLAGRDVMEGQRLAGIIASIRHGVAQQNEMIRALSHEFMKEHTNGNE